MPALFAYLIALSLLVGGGYGALNWLAAPEPVKTTGKARQKARLAAHEAAVAAAESRAPEVTGQAAPSSLSAPSETNSQPETQALPPTAASTKEADTPAHAAPAAGTKPAAASKPEVTSPTAARLANSDSEQNGQATAAATPAVKSARRVHLRQAHVHAERSAERHERSPERRGVMMILRTIDYPDGRRVSRLIPYGGSERAWASYEPD
jgi:hypothetical protein